MKIRNQLISAVASLPLFTYLAIPARAQQAPPQTWPPAQQPREYAASAAEKTRHLDWVKSPVRAANGMVVSDEGLASAAGVKILKNGGNAVDAAVAVACALAVVEPEAGNIGGGGFMLVRLKNGQSHFVDYRETAPKNSWPDMYTQGDAAKEKDASLVGWKSVGIPGTVAGLALALKTYGTKKLPEVMAPAIELAAQGFPVDARLAALLRDESPTLGLFPFTKRIFLKDGAFYNQGEILRQPELAATLRKQGIGDAESLGRLNIAAASAALADTSHVRQIRSITIDERGKWISTLDELKLPHTNSHTNFIFFNSGHPQSEVAAAMRVRRVDIGRSFPPYSNWARITIGKVDENSFAQQQLRQVLNELSSRS